MKPLVIFLLIGFAAVGCAKFKTWRGNVRDCIADNTCVENATVKANQAKQFGYAVGGGIPIPAAAMILGSILYSGVLIYTMAKGPAKKEEKITGTI